MIITVIPMASTRADWSRLTAWLVDCEKTQVTISWIELGKIVGGLPDSATKHYPQWWSGDRPITRAWHRAGYERLSLDPVARTLTLRRSTAYGNLEKASVVTSTGITRAPKAHGQEQLGSVIDLKSIDPRSTLIVLPCSGSKAFGGTSPTGSVLSTWTHEMQRARARLREKVQVDESALMPAWLRYTGGFYQSVGPTLAHAMKSGAHVVILSGGYGLVRADENIGTYEKQLKPADWPAGVLEDALVAEAIRVGAVSVVAFAASTTGYAQIVRNTRWNRAGILRAVLVTAHTVGGGAMSKVPRDLGLAFAAFWNGEFGAYPSSIRVEELK